MNDSISLQQFEELLNALEEEKNISTELMSKIELQNKEIQRLSSENFALKEELLNQQSQLLEQKELIEMQSKSDLELEEAKQKERVSEERLNKAIQKEKELLKLRQDSEQRMRAARELENNIEKMIDQKVRSEVRLYQNELDNRLENELGKSYREQTLFLMALSGYSIVFTALFIIAHWKILPTAMAFIAAMRGLFFALIAGIRGLFQIIASLPGINKIPGVWNGICTGIIIGILIYLLVRYIIYRRTIEPIRNKHKKLWDFYKRQGIASRQRYVTAMIVVDCFNAALLISNLTEGTLNYLWMWMISSIVMNVIYHTYCYRKKTRQLIPFII